MLQCKSCGLKFVETLPSREALNGIYDEVYFSNFNKVKYGYENYMGHRHLYIDLFTRRLEDIEKYKKGGRLLDVGCATGIFMDVARLRGWETSGVDISAYASGIARDYYNLDVFTGTLRDAQYEDSSFDLINMHDLIEHAPDPLGLLRESFRVLKDDGMLVVNTPNVDGIIAKLLGKKWFHYKPQTHLFYFSPATLRAMLEKAGFKMIRSAVAGRVINMEYLVGRLKYDAGVFSKILSVFFSGGPFTKSSFTFWSGEFESYAVKKKAYDNKSGA